MFSFGKVSKCKIVNNVQIFSQIQGVTHCLLIRIILKQVERKIALSNFIEQCMSQEKYATQFLEYDDNGKKEFVLYYANLIANQ